jgi:arsenate reductase (thioredoxin)
MADIGIDISKHSSDAVTDYLEDSWDYVITVCGGANEFCPTFMGEVSHRLHIGYDDPSHAKGTQDYIWSEFLRVRNEIQRDFKRFYDKTIKPQL